MWCFDIKDLPGMERDIDGGGERFTVAEWYCADEWWELEMWEEWGDYQPICYFGEDESYCYFEDMYDWLCHKWNLYYYYEDLYPYAEQICIDSNGQISQTEYGEDICILSDYEFCYMDDIMDWACDLLYKDTIICTEEYDPVCWVDWNTYSNRCFMEIAWVKEERELAEIVNGECIYG